MAKNILMAKLRFATLLALTVALRAQTINGTPARIQNLPQSSVTNLTTDLANKQSQLGFTPENPAHKDQANGYPSLDGSGKVPSGELPTISVGASSVSFTQTGTGATASNLSARANDTVNARTDFGADNSGAADATTALNNALSAVINSGKKALYIPAGTYRITSTTGTLFNLTSGATGVCVYGDGPGVTILQYAANVTLTGATTVFQLNGTNQCIHDLSILNGSGMSGSFDWTGIAINNGAFSPHLYNIEISGIYGNNLTSGGSGISTFQPYTQTMVNTTVGGSVSTGSQTVTPGNMGFIYVGQRLLIGGTSEAVTVTAKTAATFTATFANAHSSSDTVTSNSQGYQGAIIENCYIHDSFKATAIVLNSSSNVVRGCR
ncbi:MAG TPA: glycosyl hydrolase family 28-related protein, partial [Bryobacteraceae bacterium]